MKPVLYTFRRCPYAIRARLAIHISGVAVEFREVDLRNKPQSMLDCSPKGTVPVLQLADGAVKEAFLPVFTASEKPLEMAAFTKTESEGRLRCDVIAYFSPAAAEIAQIFGAQPCEQPPRDRLDLLVGDPGCWSILFPGRADKNE